MPARALGAAGPERDPGSKRHHVLDSTQVSAWLISLDAPGRREFSLRTLTVAVNIFGRAWAEHLQLSRSERFGQSPSSEKTVCEYERLDTCCCHKMAGSRRAARRQSANTKVRYVLLPQVGGQSPSSDTARVTLTAATRLHQGRQSAISTYPCPHMLAGS